MDMKLALALVTLALVAPAGNLEVGKPVPDVKLGKESLAELTKAGKVVAVYFWSEKCPFGPPMFKTLKEVATKYAGNEKVKIVAVAAFGEPKDAVEAWAKENKLEAPLIYDDGKAVAKHFGAGKVNFSFVIDAKGTLVYRGGLEPMEDAIEAALSGKAAPKSDLPFQGCRIKI
jgi:thiol-disulfide isomerase/thioredoxin